MTTITITQTDDDLRGILTLQEQNLRRLIPESVATEQGFVTLQYTLDQMRHMHQAGPSVIAKDGDTVVGYVIATLPETRQFVPELGNLFDQIDVINYEGRPLSTYAYYVVGQVCVASGYRGQALLDRMYAHHRSLYSDRFQLFVTDISALNTRSLRVHERIGFQALQRFYEPTAGEDWIVVAWDWQK